MCEIENGFFLILLEKTLFESADKTRLELRGHGGHGGSLPCREENKLHELVCAPRDVFLLQRRQLQSKRKNHNYHLFFEGISFNYEARVLYER